MSIGAVAHYTEAVVKLQSQHLCHSVNNRMNLSGWKESAITGFVRLWIDR